jgi:putative oxidoreductase
MNPSVMLSVLRIVAGLLFLEHGTSKVLGFPASPMHAAAPHVMPHYMQVLAAISGPMELIGGALITLGLLTRPVAFLLSGEMAVAYFTAHFPRGFYPLVNQGEEAVLFCFVFLYFVFSGAGVVSVDALLRRK